jgi:hypothetical protein
MIARTIIELAKAGERNVEVLCEAALNVPAGGISSPNPPPLPASPDFILSQSGERPERYVESRRLAAASRFHGDDLRRDPLEVRKATLASIVAKAHPGIRFNEHIEGDGPTVFAHACSRLFVFAALLVFGAVTLAWWGFLAWLIWRVI